MANTKIVMQKGNSSILVSQANKQHFITHGYTVVENKVDKDKDKDKETSVIANNSSTAKKVTA